MNQLEKLIRTAFQAISIQVKPKFSHTSQTVSPNVTLSAAEQEEIAEVLNECTAEDVGLHQSMDLAGRDKNYPVTYMDIVENNWFSLGVFIIHPGNKIPLHDHPNMFGALKVIYGQVQLTSYTVTETTMAGKEFVTTQDPPLTLNQSSPPTLLRPTDKNIHEIEYLPPPHSDPSSPQYPYAAFIDFLCPPYDDPDTSFLPPCNYYKIKSMSSKVGDDGKRVVTLTRCPSPENFCNNNAQFLGASLNDLIPELERVYNV